MFPDQGATLIWCVKGFEGGASATLTGPGIFGEARLSLAGIEPTDLRLLSEINALYPYGLDAFFIDWNSVVVGLPRTAHLVVEPGDGERCDAP